MLAVKDRFKSYKILVTVVALVVPVLAYAGTASQVFTPLEGNIFITSDSRGTFTCARLTENDPWLVGDQNKKTGEFKSILKTISEKKKLLKKTRDSRKKRKIEKDIEKRKAKHKKGAPICLSGPGGSVPQSTPTPTGANPTPTRTPTPTANTCFNGDLSKPGCFGLPPGASGNKRSGATYWENNCSGCHDSKSNKNYSQLQDALNKPEMIGFKPTNQQDIYDIVAWLNRFTL